MPHHHHLQQQQQKQHHHRHQTPSTINRHTTATSGVTTTSGAAAGNYGGGRSMDYSEYEQNKQQRNDVIKAAVDYVLQSGLPAYRVCTMFNIAQATLYRHLVKAQKLQRQAALAGGGNAGTSGGRGGGGQPDHHSPQTLGSVWACGRKDAPTGTGSGDNTWLPSSREMDSLVRLSQDVNRKVHSRDVIQGKPEGEEGSSLYLAENRNDKTPNVSEKNSIGKQDEEVMLQSTAGGSVLPMSSAGELPVGENCPYTSDPHPSETAGHFLDVHENPSETPRRFVGPGRAAGDDQECPGDSDSRQHSTREVDGNIQEVLERVHGSHDSVSVLSHSSETADANFVERSVDGSNVDSVIILGDSSDEMPDAGVESVKNVVKEEATDFATLKNPGTLSASSKAAKAGELPRQSCPVTTTSFLFPCTTTTTTSTAVTPLNIPTPPYPVPTRTTTLTIPPIEPKLKPEDLPPDTKPEDVARLTECHVLKRVPPTEKKRYPSKRCKVCLSRSGYTPSPQRKHPKESVYYCPQCPSKPGLCCYPCYYVYHSKLHFWEPDDEMVMAGGDGSGGVAGAGGSFLGLGDRRVDDYSSSTGSYDTAQGSGSGGEYNVGSGGMLTDGQSFSGSVVEIDVDQPEQKFCPVPVYGESVYGPGGL